MVTKQKLKMSVANPTAKATNNLGHPYQRWHPKNPKNAVIVPVSLTPTKR